MTNYRYLGYGVTNENGVAKLEYNSEGQKIDHSYTGVGAGEIDVLASLDNPVSEGSIVSGTYPVCDALYYDNMASNTLSRYYYVTTVTSANYSDNAINVTFGASSRYMRLRIPDTLHSIGISGFQGKTLTFKANIETSTNTSCSIIYSTPTESNVSVAGNTISSDGLLIVEDAEIPNNATQILFSIQSGTTGATIKIKDFLIYVE